MTSLFMRWAADRNDSLAFPNGYTGLNRTGHTEGQRRALDGIIHTKVHALGFVVE